jgi:hypothetical protein
MKALMRKKWIAIPFDYNDENYKKVKQIRKSVNNMIAFSSAVGIAYEDSSLLDRQIRHLFMKLQQIEDSVRAAIQVILICRNFVNHH